MDLQVRTSEVCACVRSTGKLESPLKCCSSSTRLARPQSWSLKESGPSQQPKRMFDGEIRWKCERGRSIGHPSPPVGGLRVQNSVQIKCERKHTVMCYQWFLHVEIIKCVYFDLVCLDFISVECFKNQAVIYSLYIHPPNQTPRTVFYCNLIWFCGLKSFHVGYSPTLACAALPCGFFISEDLHCGSLPASFGIHLADKQAAAD